ncbi:MAG: glycosyltransferase family 9 protein [Elainellaceae cyanobacterium]
MPYPDPPLNLPAAPRIAVVRALPGLGDFLCSVPGLRSLRAAFPQAHVALVGLPQVQPLVARFSAYIDELLPFPGYPGIPEGWQGPEPLVPFLQQVRAPRYDLALQMHGSGLYSNPFTMLLGADRTAGFYRPGDYCPGADFLPYPDAAPEIERYLTLVQSLGVQSLGVSSLDVPNQGIALEFPISDLERERYRALANANALRSPYVCLHAGASRSDRRWPPKSFAAVGNALAQRGYSLVLTGSEGERAIADAVAQQLQRPALNLAGQTALGTLAALLEKAALLVCNDTGVSHLAATLKVPSVVVFSNSDQRRWAPLDAKRHRAVSYTGEQTVSSVLDHCHSLLREVAYV